MDFWPSQLITNLEPSQRSWKFCGPIGQKSIKDEGRSVQECCERQCCEGDAVFRRTGEFPRLSFDTDPGRASMPMFHVKRTVP